MNNQVPKYFTQARASFLLGMPEAEFDRISKESGLGHVEHTPKNQVTSRLPPVSPVSCPPSP